MNVIHEAGTYFAELRRTLEQSPMGAIDRMAQVLLRAYDYGHAVYIFGNGGSAALASHLACDLGKGTVNGSGKRLRVVALTDNVPLLTAWANDTSYEYIFSEQLTTLLQPQDVAFAISGSGNSLNVVHGLRVAKELGAVTVGLTGFQGGKMKDLCDECMIVPSDNMQIIEDLHLCASHALFTVVRTKLCERVRAFAGSMGTW